MVCVGSCLSTGFSSVGILYRIEYDKTTIPVLFSTTAYILEQRVFLWLVVALAGRSVTLWPLRGA